jgi:hypothetical protein
MGGWIGGIGGACLGLIGALIGVLGSRPKYIGVASAVMLVTIVAGFALLVVGMVAVCLHQPYAVYYPLLLSGLLTMGLLIPLFFYARRLRQQNELRKMRAMDAS